jgi:predicted dehydrogenase
MKKDWGIVGCGHMAKEYCKALTSKGINPQVFCRDLTSSNVKSFQAMFPQIEVKLLATICNEISNWLVCTSIDSHESVCGKLEGSVYCEKPYSHSPIYDVDKNVSVLMNRRYYYWVEFIKKLISDGKIIKVIAFIPEESIDFLIPRGMHVIDLLWYLTGPFQSATRIGTTSPSYVLSTDTGLPLVINMNYGAHENFSLRFYGENGDVYEAKPLEAFSTAEGMEVHEPDDENPLRSYRPIISTRTYVPTNLKPGLGELIDDLIQGSATRLPTLSEHRRIHQWMQDNML